MSFLSGKLPSGVFIDGRLYRMNTDFKVWLRVEELLRGEGTENIPELLKLCYIDLPPTLSQAIEGISDFFTMGQAGGDKKAAAGKTAVIDFEYDAKFIWAAFMAEYQIDLHTAHMHWHDFLTLLGSLSEDNMLCRIMQYRSVNLSKIKDKEQRAFYRRMQKKYKLPDRRSESEKESEMAEAMW